jgi:nucleotide-binding universal stress UspA family protein
VEYFNRTIKEVIKMYKRILVPLDTSKLAEIALPYAEELAAKLGSEVILIHVRTSADAPDNVDHRAYLSKIAATTEQDIKKSPALPPGEKVKVASAMIGSPGLLTHPAEEILDYAEKENISLIVMATHGRTGIRRWTLGDTANKVARASKCPVLLIRASADKPESVHLDKILVPLDGSKQSEAVLPYIENLASKLKTKVSLLNVVEPLYHIYPYSEPVGYYSAAGIIRVPYNEEEIKPMKEVAEKYVQSVSEKLETEGIKTSYEVKVGSTGEEIIKAEEEIHPDIVAMSTHGNSGFGRWEHGSVADKVLHHGNTPLLLVRPKQPV